MSEKEIKKILDENKVLKEENKRLRQLVAYIKKTIQEYEDGIVQFHNAIDAEKQAALRQAYLEADKGIVGKLMIKVDDLPISGRTKSAFRSSNVKTLGDVAALKLVDILRFRGMGKTRVKEITDILDFYGLEFGMDSKGIIEEALKDYGKKKKKGTQ